MTLIIFWDKRLASYGISTDVAIFGNLVLFIATLISFYLYHKALLNDRVAVFLRMIYSGMFVKNDDLFIRSHHLYQYRREVDQ